MDIEEVFGDVDANTDADGVIEEHIPALLMRARSAFGRGAAQAAVRASFKRPAMIQLSHGLGGPERVRSIAGGRGPAVFATLRRPAHGCLHLSQAFV